ncbi:hypothetical protein GCM10009676_16610 [Prauserella halophila]|uniref:Uncharacterized protein n=1 Tax=Prauserella halophila TaxID=185641 RepID=A0ABP4GTR4_9PSEU
MPQRRRDNNAGGAHIPGTAHPGNAGAGSVSLRDSGRAPGESNTDPGNHNTVPGDHNTVPGDHNTDPGKCNTAPGERNTGAQEVHGCRYPRPRTSRGAPAERSARDQPTVSTSLPRTLPT